MKIAAQDYWENRRGKLYILCFMLAALAMALLVIRYYPHFETNDDMAVSWIVNGIKGSHDPHVIIQSTLLGYIYCFFYHMTTQVAWYTVIQYAVLLMSFAAIGYASRRLLGRIGWLFYMMVLVIGGYETFITVQYTKASGLAAVAGTALLLLFYLDWEHDRQNLRTLLGALVLLAFAFMYRENMTVVCMGLLVPGVIGYFLADRKELKIKGKRAGILVSLVLVLFGGLYLGNKLTFRSELWRYFYAFDDPRVKLLDFGMPSFEENEEELEKLGIDYTAYNMICNWTYADPEVFNPETFNAMVDMKTPVRYISRAQIKSFLKQVPVALLHYRLSALLCAALLYFLLGGLRSRRGVALLLLSGIFYGGIYYILFCSGRWAMNRVAVPMMFAQIVNLLMLTQCDAIETQGGHGSAAWRRYVGTAAVVLTMGLYFHGSFGSYATLRRGSDTEKNIKHTGEVVRSYLRKITEDQDHFYISTPGAIIRDNCYGPFDIAEQNLMCNFIQLGGWAMNSQQYVSLCEKEGITNPMRFGVDNPRVICVDTHINLTQKYLEKHMGKNIYYEEIPAAETGLSGLPLYRLHS